jgi:diguanylate cyclase (GGDEF)-like protein
MMPDMDGFETFRRLREFEDAENRKHVPVIFLTGDNDIDVEMQGLKIGASDFIRKPVNNNILVSRIRNIISSTKTIENLTEEAMTDGLTGFYNKSFVSSKMGELCKKGEGTLIVLDLDNFKPVNDIYGHDTGDIVLKIFADLVKDGCDDNDVLCRIGGDEFLVLTQKEMTREKIAAFISRLNSRIVEECVNIMGKDFNVPIGVSSGVISLTYSKVYDTLFKLADKELYRVKQNGKHGFGLFDPDKQNNDEELISPQTALDRMNILCAERGEPDGAMVVGQDSFISISRFMDRYVRLNKESFIRLVFSVFTDDVSDRDEVLLQKS